LMKTLWPDTFVEESNLSQHIFQLRKALGEKAHDPQSSLPSPAEVTASLRRWWNSLTPMANW